MRRGVYIPPFGELADVRALGALAASAESYGWNGVFLWDHILRPSGEPIKIADTTVALAVIASATTRLRLGPMVTPLVRRRPQKLAREVISLDHLSGGRLILGLGLGVDTSGELSKFAETVDPVARGALLDEGAALLASLLSAAPVHHDGPGYRATDVTFAPATIQRPRPPFWFAARRGARRPVARAARYEGVFAIELGPAELVEVVEQVRAARGDLDGFDVAVVADDPADLAAFARAGATWAMTGFASGATVADVDARLRDGPGG